MIQPLFVSNKAFETAHGVPHNRQNPHHPDALYEWSLASVIEYMLEDEEARIC